MDDKEINETIAEWCGIKTIYSIMDKKNHWYSGDTIDTELYEKPDFLDPIDGLGLLFKYAVPKLYYYELHKGGEDSKYHYAMAVLEINTPQYALMDKDPTRALCMAIYKLITPDEAAGDN